MFENEESADTTTKAIKSSKEESADTTTNRGKEESADMPSMALLEDLDDKVKAGKGLKILTQNKLLTRLHVLLAQVKAGNNSYKLKSEIRQTLYLFYQHNKILKNFTTI